MIEACENLPLAQKAAQHEICVHAGPDQLDGHLLFELIIVALGQVNSAHAAVAYATNNPVRADVGFFEYISLLFVGKRYGDSVCERSCRAFGGLLFGQIVGLLLAISSNNAYVHLLQNYLLRNHNFNNHSHQVSIVNRVTAT